MFVVQKMVVVGDLLEITVLTWSEMSIGQRAHFRSIVAVKGFPPGKALALDFPGIQVIHDPPDISVQLIQRVIDSFLQFLQQVGLQPLHALLHGGLALPASSTTSKLAMFHYK